MNFEAAPNAAEKTIVKRFEDGDYLIWNGRIELSDIGLREKIRSLVSNPENFLGEGGTSKVFDLGDQCIKLMKFQPGNSAVTGNKNKRNSPETEFYIQNSLRELIVSGVYAPRVAGYYSGKENAAIIMERLDAVNLQLVINGDEKLPPSFKSDVFFDALNAYIENMHDAGVIHGDLDCRNIMIDNKSGLPRVIDFGLSMQIDEETPKTKKLMLEELGKIDKAYSEMKSYFKNNKKNEGE